MATRKRKVGRPKLPKGQIKNVIAMRLSDAEKRQYGERASLSGIGVSDWIRKTIEHGGKPMTSSEVRKELVSLQKKRIGFIVESVATGRIEGAQIADCSEMPAAFSLERPDGTLVKVEVEGAEFVARNFGGGEFLEIKLPSGKFMVLHSAEKKAQ